jgi:hypothetical protein
VRCVQNPEQPTFTESWFETTRYLATILYTRLICSAHVNQVGKKAAKGLGVLGSVLNWRTSLFVRHGVLLYKQLIRPTLDLPPSATSRKCSVYNSSVSVLKQPCTLVTDKFTRIPFFADHARALTESFDKKLTDAGNTLFRQLENTCARQGLNELRQG